MQKLCAHIETLLDTHNFVVIPGFGGFVAAHKNATLLHGTIYPPTKTIGFNPALTYNDGLLSQSVAQEKHISLDAANTWVEGKTFELIQYLHQYHRLPFGHLGQFYLQEGKVNFQPSMRPLELSANYGLSAIYFPEVEKEQKTIVKPLQPAGRRFNYAAVAAVIAFLMLLIPMHFGQQQANYRASFVAPPVIEEVEKPSVDNADVKPACTPYHVVIGSFHTQVKALQFLDELPTELEQSQIVYSDHRFRIIAASYETEEDGIEGVKLIASAFPAYHDAWLLLYNP